MRMKVITAIMVTLFLASIIAIAIPVGATPTKRRVPQDYATIQAAVNHANPGDTIVVYTGTYQETVTIQSNDHDIKLKGEGRPIIMDKPGGSLLYGVDLKGGAYNIEISGFEIKGFDEVDDAGIFGRSGARLSNIIIHNNTIHDNYNGIDFRAAPSLFPPGHSKLRISHNEICMNLEKGIFLLRVSNSTIDHNMIGQNTVGISVRIVSDLTIAHNKIFNNHRFGMRWAYVDNTKASHNKIEENGGRDGFRIVGTNTGNLIEHNKVLNNTGNGIYLMDNTKNNYLEYNHVLGNGDGVSTKDIQCENGVGSNAWKKNKYETATLLL
jgi:nitrous oxidase accessory protein